MKLQELSPVALPECDLPEDVVIEPDALAAIPKLAEKHLGNNWVYLADAETLAACDGAAWGDRVICLPSKPLADTQTIGRIIEALPDGHKIVAVGSGTINDLAKRASTLVNRPYIAVGTTASMNGYASGIAAILDGGLKTTVPARPPRWT